MVLRRGVRVRKVLGGEEPRFQGGDRSGGQFAAGLAALAAFVVVVGPVEGGVLRFVLFDHGGGAGGVHGGYYSIIHCSSYRWVLVLRLALALTLDLAGAHGGMRRRVRVRVQVRRWKERDGGG